MWVMAGRFSGNKAILSLLDPFGNWRGASIPISEWVYWVGMQYCSVKDSGFNHFTKNRPVGT